MQSAVHPAATQSGGRPRFTVLDSVQPPSTPKTLCYRQAGKRQPFTCPSNTQARPSIQPNNPAAAICAYTSSPGAHPSASSVAHCLLLESDQLCPGTHYVLRRRDTHLNTLCICYVGIYMFHKGLVNTSRLSPGKPTPSGKYKEPAEVVQASSKDATWSPP